MVQLFQVGGGGGVAVGESENFIRALIRLDEGITHNPSMGGAGGVVGR